MQTFTVEHNIHSDFDTLRILDAATEATADDVREDAQGNEHFDTILMVTPSEEREPYEQALADAGYQVIGETTHGDWIVTRNAA